MYVDSRYREMATSDTVESRDRSLKILTSEFAMLDEEMSSYIGNILEAPEEISTEEDLYEAIGELLIGVSPDKSEQEVRKILRRIHRVIQTNSDASLAEEKFALLDAPINLRNQIIESRVESNSGAGGSILDSDWSIVDKNRLEKAENKSKQKQARREQEEAGKLKDTNTHIANTDFRPTLNQVNIRNAPAVSSGNWQDIRLEGIDLCYGGCCLLENSGLCLVRGRRYGLVGRNGIGKTSLLRAMSSGDLKLPGNLRLVHVEQEMDGDGTVALEAVVRCDLERSRLVALEAELMVSEESGAVGSEGKGTSGKRGKATKSKKPVLSLSEVQSQLLAIEADKAHARAGCILSGLGFSLEMQRGPTNALSGGWRMRLALAGALFAAPDLLLLDEPTNMLDLKAVLWLEMFLEKWSNAMLLVSHDRTFLDNVTTDVFHMRDKTLTHYKGNYTQFETTKDERLRHQQKQYEAQEMKKEHLQAFVDRFRVNANRASQAQCKLKVIEKMPDLRPVEKEVEVTLRFPVVKKLGPPVLTLEEVSFCYPGQSEPIFSNISIGGDTESRIALVGENGAGKTTLLRLLAGELMPTTGNRVANRHLKIGYFTQHHVDQLILDFTPIQMLAKVLPGLDDERYRWELGAFGLSGDLPIRPICTLSGGQKSRLALALLCAKKPNFLFLDEPTNHLDVETVQALGRSLSHYRGGVILVSHDESLVNLCCKEVWLVKMNGKGLERMEGVSQYKKALKLELKSFL